MDGESRLVLSPSSYCVVFCVYCVYHQQQKQRRASPTIYYLILFSSTQGGEGEALNKLQAERRRAKYNMLYRVNLDYFEGCSIAS